MAEWSKAPESHSIRFLLEVYMNKVLVTLGDWSDDGHGKYDKVEVLTSCNVREMQDAYKASCRKTGVSFNHNDDFTGIAGDTRKYHVATEYEDSSLTKEVVDAFTDLGCPWEDLGMDPADPYLDRETFLSLLMWFIGLSSPGFEWKLPDGNEQTPVFNGWWDSNLNVQLGYGLYN